MHLVSTWTISLIFANALICIPPAIRFKYLTQEILAFVTVKSTNIIIISYLPCGALTSAATITAPTTTARSRHKQQCNIVSYRFMVGVNLVYTGETLALVTISWSRWLAFCGYMTNSRSRQPVIDGARRRQCFMRPSIKSGPGMPMPPPWYAFQLLYVAIHFATF